MSRHKLQYRKYSRILSNSILVTGGSTFCIDSPGAGILTTPQSAHPCKPHILGDIVSNAARPERNRGATVRPRRTGCRRIDCRRDKPAPRLLLPTVVECLY